MHGSLWETRCSECGDVRENRQVSATLLSFPFLSFPFLSNNFQLKPQYDFSPTHRPITPALAGSGSPDSPIKHGQFTLKDLPTCEICKGLLRPHVVWFGESLDPMLMEGVQQKLLACELLIVVGTSAVVYPAASFAPQVRKRGGVVAEFNLETTANTAGSHFAFSGPAGELLPDALGVSV